MLVTIGSRLPRTEVAVEVLHCDNHRRMRTALHHATLMQLRSEAPQVEGIFIPCQIEGSQYDWQYMVEHIRLDSSGLAQAPICVYGSTEEIEEAYGQLSSAKSKLYEEIAVNHSDSPTEQELPLITKSFNLDEFRGSIANHPRFSTGRHDMANRWGALCLLWGVTHLNDRHQAELDELRSEIEEDTFYKKKLIDFDVTHIEPNVKTNLIREQANYIKLTSSDRTFNILIIEDQWKDGWEAAYTDALKVSENISIDHAITIEEARTKIKESYDLILVDARLDEDRVASNDQHDADSVESLSGYRLSEKIREYSPAVPIVIATASNKSWTLEAFMKCGANSYWVKESPSICHSINHVLLNTTSFYKHINQCLSWSNISRNWIEDLYLISNLVNRTNINIGSSVKQKATSFNALMHSSFDPFSRKLEEGLQFNLAFITLFSLVNDFVECICLDSDKKGEYCFFVNGNKHLAFRIKNKEKKERSYILSEECVKRSDANKSEYRDLPDSFIMEYILQSYDIQTFDFTKARTKRNRMPLTHGKTDFYQRNKTSQIEPNDISALVKIFVELAKKLGA